MGQYSEVTSADCALADVHRKRSVKERGPVDARTLREEFPSEDPVPVLHGDDVGGQLYWRGRFKVSGTDRTRGFDGALGCRVQREADGLLVVLRSSSWTVALLCARQVILVACFGYTSRLPFSTKAQAVLRCSPPGTSLPAP